MAKFILDEWLWADLGGENGPERQRESFRLLEAIHGRCDRIVIVEESPFARKFWSLARQAGPGDPRRKPVKLFKLGFLLNSEKADMFHAGSAHPPEEDLEEPVNPDDRYLVRALRVSRADALVTTDGRLIELLRPGNLPVRHRDEFVADYLRAS